MEYGKQLGQLGVGDTVEGFYILKSAFSKTTNNGNPFLAATLADVSGVMDAKVWNYGGPVGPGDEGKVVKVRGSVSEFRGSLQMSIERIRLAEDQDVYNLEDLVPCAPLNAQQAMEEVLALVDSMKDQDYQAVCREMLKRHGDSFYDLPAAKNVHHGFIHGLLMHTLNMMKIADCTAAIYADTVDRDLLLAGTLLHDFGKEAEFLCSDLGLVTEYSVRGNLLGHLTMGAEEIGEVAAQLGIPGEKTMLLQHMILSHHGEPEYGAAVKPMCAESELLSLIDLVDSRMEIYRETFQRVPVGSFSGRIFALDKSIYHH